VKKLGNEFGRASIRFGDPVEIDSSHNAIIPDLEEDSYLDNNTLLATVTSPKNHRSVYTSSGRSKYKNYVKVFLNELLRTVRTD
jgi:hypothetical protein